MIRSYSLHSPRIFLATALLLLFTQFAAAADLSRVRPERAGMSSERLALLDATLKEYVAEGLVAGQVAMVLRNGRVVYSVANGKRSETQPMTMDTIFRIASQTKAIVSAGIMILHERGDLDIMHPLSRYIPEWGQAQVAVPSSRGTYNLEPVSRPITLRHLLTHTSGVSYGSGPAKAEWDEAGFEAWYFLNKDEPILETITRMAALPIDAHPGEQWIYGYNTDILGAVIEVASGKDLNSFLREEIFEPLGMTDTHFYLPADKRSRLATVYRPGRNGVEPITARDGMQSQGLYVQGQGPGVSYSGGAGLVSTAADYARFLQMTLNGGVLDGKRLLSPKTIELMTTSHLGDIPFRDGTGFGLGFSVVEDLGARGQLGSVGEYGWGGAYHSTYWVDPKEELIVIYLTQLIPTNGLDDYSKLRSGIYQAIVE